MLLPALIVIGFIFGLAVGRWWALLASLALGVWIGLAEEVEVPGVILGLGYGLVSASGIAVGVVVRRQARRPHG